MKLLFNISSVNELRIRRSSQAEYQNNALTLIYRVQFLKDVSHCIMSHGLA